MTMKYNNPAGGAPSTMGEQMNTFFYKKKALKEIAKEQYFGQMADTINMPKHYGKEIRVNHYLPMLDDANINDQGIDANGVTTTRSVTIELVPAGVTEASNGMTNYFAVGEGASDTAALAAAKAKAEAILAAMDLLTTDYATSKTALESDGWLFREYDAVPVNGNLYGSSKDFGTIQGKLPLLTENGGRVNRVGFTRRTIVSTLEKLGIFDEYTKESMDFDSDEDLEMHIHRLLLEGANEIVEDMLQIDIINSAGILRYGGDATSTDEISGETGSISEVDYDDLVKLSISLDNNRTDKHTQIISGSRMVDTRTINAARYMYIGSELLPTMERMVDYHNERAWVSVEKYAQAGNVARGEEGSCGKFRFIVVPEMMHWAGAGASVSNNAGYHSTDGNYDVFPMVAIGNKAFTTVGFQTDGKTVKFKIKHVKPESETSYGFTDPFGEKGFMSIKWYYGFMPLRPERIALIKTVARL
jgi:N4-gp56 family major capsid protein